MPTLLLRLVCIIPMFFVGMSAKEMAGYGTARHSPLEMDNDDVDIEIRQDMKQQELHLFGMGSTGQAHHEKYLMGTLTGLTCGAILCTGYYLWQRYKKKRFLAALLSGASNDNAPLINKL